MVKVNKIFIGAIMVLGIFLCPGNISAQVLTIDSILNAIEKNQPELKVYDAKINAINTYAKGAKSLDPPQVGGGFFMTPYNPQMWKADPSMNTNGMGSLMLSAQQMFMNPKKLNANSEYMKSMSGVETEMKKLIDWYNNNKQKTHPIKLATIFHSRFEQIHPFEDGNGRTGRILINAILLEHNLPPLIIRKTMRTTYFSALEASDKGHTHVLERFIIDKFKKTFNNFFKIYVKYL